MPHFIDTTKCASCTVKACEETCFRGIYKVDTRNGQHICRIVRDVSWCLRCHKCTTACPHHALQVIDEVTMKENATK
ncbi:MAG: hypothetical protein RBG13Loki_3254 [Promethearchaeota archaeon CR_4]|nr:MAG: hypothetical protein RBG13Loki_3254 [Candidatus Lokiarchaeota archaeon CR_4]